MKHQKLLQSPKPQRSQPVRPQQPQPQQPMSTEELYRSSRPSTRTQAFYQQKLESEIVHLKQELEMQKKLTKQAEDALKRTKNNIVSSVLVLITCGCLCTGGWCVYSLNKTYTEAHIPQAVIAKTVEVKEEEEGEKKQYLNINWTEIQKEYPECIGWLYIPKTEINYPIMQNKENGDYYLNHNNKGEYSNLGSIFIDSIQDENFKKNENTIIYGHSVEITGGMFTDLEKYTDQKFYDEHPEFYILTPQENYKVDVRAFSETVDGSAYYIIDSKDTRDEVLERQKNSALYFTDQDTNNKTFITLSTCKRGTNGAKKYVLQGVLDQCTDDIEIIE